MVKLIENDIGFLVSQKFKQSTPEFFLIKPNSFDWTAEWGSRRTSKFKSPLRVPQNLLEALSHPFMVLDYQLDFFPHQQHQFFLEQEQNFFKSNRIFLPQHRFRTHLITNMTYSKQKFYYEADEATFMKLQTLTGKSFFTNKDFQNIITSLIGKIYETNKGKRL